MKTMKKLLAAAFISVTALTACQEEQFADYINDENFHATVETFGTGTRTAIGESLSVVWTSEDRIAIFEGSDKGYAYQVMKTSVGSSFGEFSPVGNLSTEGSGAAIEGTVAVYPFSEELSVTPDGNGGFVIDGLDFPEEQTYTTGSFSDKAFPMTAVCENGGKSLSFKNIGGVLRLSLKGDYAVSSITVKGNSGELISGSGTVTVGPDGIPAVTMSDDASRSVTLVCSPAVQLDTDNAREFYISIPVTEFETGFTVTVTDSEGNTYRKQTTLANPVSRSTIHVMPPTDLSEDISDEATENYIDLGIGRNAHITSYDAASGSISLEYSSSTIPFIEAGKAFVLPVEQGGDIRVIDSHTTSGNTVTLQTSEGNMCDLFKNTSFTLSTSSEPDTRSSGEWNVITPSAYGYIDEDGEYHELYNVLTKAGKHPEYTSDMELWSFEKDYSDTEILSTPAGSLSWESCKFEAGLNGIFKFDFGEKKIDQISSKGDIRYFSYELKGSLDIDMLLAYEFEASYSKEDDKIIKQNIIPSLQFTFVVGAVPVLLQVDTDLGQEYSFSVSGSVKASAGINLNNEISVGAEWTPDNGVRPIKSVNATETLYDPTFEISASAEEKVSYYHRIGIKIYKFFGPWVEPRAYMAETVNAGLRVSASGESNLGWKAVTSVGIDLNMGLGLDFLIAEKELWSEKIPLSNIDIFEAPKKITRISPTQGAAVMKGQMIDAVFKAESYSPVTKKYYPCPAALIYFDTKDGTYSPKAAIADINGQVTTKWTPKPNTATKGVTEHNMKASIIDHEGEAIDETTLTVSFEEAEQWVDLGLSVLWAGWNVGADSPEEPGGYYAWGEITEKNSYTWDNYRYVEEFWCVEYGEGGKEYRWPEWIGTFIGREISCTSYDVARAEWGDGARLPTRGDILELHLKCDFEYGTYNGVAGNYVTGPNGNSIFLPFTGDYWPYDDNRLGDLNMGYFWSGTYDDSNRNNAILLVCNENAVRTEGFSHRAMGATVRPVRNIDGSDIPVEDDPEHDGYDPEDNPFYEYRDKGNEGGGGSGGEEEEDGLWVDLGLSVKWATRNVGASSPEEPGGYYAWGETEEKPDYTWDNYLFCNPETFVFEHIGSEISGTDYDVAHVKWGDGARMPTRMEIQELIDNCTFEFILYGDLPEARGLLATGPNGNTIFIPNGGYYIDYDLWEKGEQANIWSGTFSELVHEGSKENNNAYCMLSPSFASPWEEERERAIGMNVRPVKD